MTRGPMTGAFVAGGGARLRSRWWETESPRGRILLVHGLGEHGGRWVGVGDFFAARGFSVFTYDQRGHGESHGARGRLASFEVLLDDLDLACAELRRTLPGSGEPFLYGHSMGGLVLIRFLQTREVRTPGAVLSAPWLGTALDVPAWKRGAARLLRRFAPDVTVTTGLDAATLSRDPGVQRAYHGDALVHGRMSPRMLAEIEHAQERALKEGIDPGVPLLVLVPGADPVTDIGLTRRWAGGLAGKGVRLLSLPGLLHEPHNEPEGEEVLERVVQWMEGTRTPGTPSGIFLSPARGDRGKESRTGETGPTP